MTDTEGTGRRASMTAAGRQELQRGPSHVDDAAPRWTAEAIARLRELAAAEVAAEVIAEAMHRPMNEVVAKAAELGLALRPRDGAH